MVRGLLAWLALAGLTQAREPVTAADGEFFEKRVRPVLAENCHSCHGPKKQMGSLRLDTRAGLLQGGENGLVVKPGDPDASPLIKAVRHDGDRKMPPKSKLKPDQIADLSQWVRRGVPWPAASKTADLASDAWKKHWAFQPVRKPALPLVKQRDWPSTSVNSFILSKLEQKGLTPSPSADRRTLLRRATFDLLGLPPTPEEIAAFQSDASPDAWEKVVDRLLASPHYGERWGRHWLDVARYADTKGYVFFEEPPYPWAWTYRDYVIQAFNEDLPYDRFLVEQLAADKLDLGSDRRPLAAMGFLTVGGRFMNNPHDILDDRIDVVTRGLLGLTVTCARCHDHKFDPIPTKDYYSLYGVFASSVEPDVPPLFQDVPRTPVYEAFEKEMKARETKLSTFLERKRQEVTTAAKQRVAEYLLAAHAMRDQPDTGEFMLLAEGNDLNPAMLTRWRAYLRRADRAGHPVFAAWHALAALPEKEFAARASETLRTLSDSGKLSPSGERLLGALAAKPLQSLADVAHVYSEVLNGVEQKWQKAKAKRLPDDAEEELRQVFHGADAPPNVPANLFNDLSLLPDRPSQGELQKLRKEVEQWRATGPGAPPRAMTLEDLPTPIEPRVFVRGNPGNLGPAVALQLPELLAGRDRQPFRDGSGRLELARAIVDRDNPLTSRVLVNRVWMHHFGRGLVATPGDFGLRSEAPSHPALLDHLATMFTDDGWSIKRLHRHILLSSTYRQRSDDRPDCRATDPENVLLWRMNRRRLDFESLRDSVLSVSGRMDRTLGGPSTKDLLSASANRRTLYGHLDRLNVPGLLRTFDFPSPDATNPQRDATTVPQQALFLMNNAFAADCARRLVQRPDVVALKDEAARIDRLHRLLYGRGPTAEESRLGRDYLSAVGGMVSWERYAHALMMTNEFVFVD